MGATASERETTELVRKYATHLRDTTHGSLYSFRNQATGRQQTVLISRSMNGDDIRKWRNALGDVRRAVREVFGINFTDEKEDDVEQSRQTPPPTPQRPPTKTAVIDVRPGALAGLVVRTKEQRVIMTSRDHTLELAPHHVHALLRGAGYEVPDDAKVTFTNEGYVRIAWTKVSETTED